MELAWDRIICQLKARRTVTSDTVRIFVQATLTQSGEEKMELREIILNALTPVFDGAWRVAETTRPAPSSIARPISTRTVNLIDRELASLKSA